MADGADDTTPLGKFLSWFPSGKDDPKGWRFDVITLLAIIGEGSVAEHAQTISASSLCLLPRIIPAPQALLKPIRPQRLPEVRAKMAGVYGGVVLDTVGFFANIIHPLEDLKPFAFKVLEIKHKHLIEAPETTTTTTPLSPPGWKKRLAFGRGGGGGGGGGGFNINNKKGGGSGGGGGSNKKKSHGGIPTSPAGTGIGSAVLLASSVKEAKEKGYDEEEDTIKQQQEKRRESSRAPSPRPPPPSFSETTTATSDLKQHLDDEKSSPPPPESTTATTNEDNHPVKVTVTAKSNDELSPTIPTSPPTSAAPHPQSSHSQARSQSKTRPQTTPLQTNTTNNNTTLNPPKRTKTATFAFSQTQALHSHLELGRGLERRATLAEKFTDMVTNPTMANSQDRYTVPPTLYSPLHIISVLSFLLTIALVTCSTLWHDGTAIVAILLISLASSVVGYASYWRPLLMNRRTTNKVPKGDVVIRTREGAFILIKCTEEVARELYSGTEECQYVVSTKFYRAFMGVGMVLLMISVVLLGNCGWESQAFIGASYIVLNGVYWALGLLPHRYFWDLGRYEFIDVTPEDAKRADEHTGEDPREGTPSFTRTLWYAIRETKHGAWVVRSGALPGTDQWRRWLGEAVRAAKEERRDWKAVGRKNEIMKEEITEFYRKKKNNNKKRNNAGGEDGEMEMGDGIDDFDFDLEMEMDLDLEMDMAEQQAPLVQVQGPARAPTFG